jgi:hypothetical protein
MDMAPSKAAECKQQPAIYHQGFFVFALMMISITSIVIRKKSIKKLQMFSFKKNNQTRDLN